MRRKDETKWGKGYCQERAKKEGHHHGYSYCPDGGDKLGKEDRDDLSNRKERLRNKVSEKVSMRSGEGMTNVGFVYDIRVHAPDAPGHKSVVKYFCLDFYSYHQISFSQ